MADEELPDIHWGKRKGSGGGRKRYESFKFEGREEVFLFDTVYLFPDNEGDVPYVAKVLDLYDGRHEGKPAKMAKLRWFFRASDIPEEALARARPRANELFLSHGDPAEVNHICSLDAVDRKCNMVCTAKHPANADLNLEDIQNADEVFYRMYDTEKEVISIDLTPLIEELGAEAVFRKTEICGASQATGGTKSPPQLLSGDGNLAKEDGSEARVELEASDVLAKDDKHHEERTMALAGEEVGEEGKETQKLVGSHEQPCENIMADADGGLLQGEEAGRAGGVIEGNENGDSDHATSFQSGWEEDVLRGVVRLVCDDGDEVDQRDQVGGVEKSDQEHVEVLQRHHSDAGDQGGLGRSQCQKDTREQGDLVGANVYLLDGEGIPIAGTDEPAGVGRRIAGALDHEIKVMEGVSDIAEEDDTTVPLAHLLKKRKRDGASGGVMGIASLTASEGRGANREKQDAVTKKKRKVISGKVGKEGKEGGKVTVNNKAPTRKKALAVKNVGEGKQSVDVAESRGKGSMGAVPSGDHQSSEQPTIVGNNEGRASAVLSGDVLTVESPTVHNKAPTRKKALAVKNVGEGKQSVAVKASRGKGSTGVSSKVPSVDQQSAEPTIVGKDEGRASGVPSGDALIVQTPPKIEKAEAGDGMFKSDDANRPKKEAEKDGSEKDGSEKDGSQKDGSEKDGSEKEAAPQLQQEEKPGAISTAILQKVGMEEMVNSRVPGKLSFSSDERSIPHESPGNRKGASASEGLPTLGKSKPVEMACSNDGKIESKGEARVANKSVPKKRSLADGTSDSSMGLAASAPTSLKNGLTQVGHAVKKIKPAQPAGHKASMKMDVENNNEARKRTFDKLTVAHKIEGEDGYSPGLIITLGVDVMALPAGNGELAGATIAHLGEEVEQSTKVRKIKVKKSPLKMQTSQSALKPVKKLHPSGPRLGQRAKNEVHAVQKKLGRSPDARSDLDASKPSLQPSKGETSLHSLEESIPQGEVKVQDSRSLTAKLQKQLSDAVAAFDARKLLSRVPEPLGTPADDGQGTSIRSERQKGECSAEEAVAALAGTKEFSNEKEGEMVILSGVVELETVEEKPQTAEVEKSRLRQKAEKQAKVAAEDGKGARVAKREKHLTRNDGHLGSVIIIGLPYWDADGRSLYDVDPLISIEDKNKTEVEHHQSESSQSALGKPAAAAQGQEKTMQQAEESVDGRPAKYSLPSLGMLDEKKVAKLSKKASGIPGRPGEANASYELQGSKQSKGLKLPLRATDGNLVGKESKLLEGASTGEMSRERFLQLKSRIEATGEKRVVIRDGKLAIVKKKKKVQSALEPTTSDTRVKSDGMVMAEERGNQAVDKLEMKDPSSEDLRSKADAKSAAPVSVGTVKGSFKSSSKVDELPERRPNEKVSASDTLARRLDDMTEGSPDSVEEAKKSKKLKPKGKDWGAATTLRESREAMFALTRESTKMVPRISGRALPWAKELPIAAAQGRVLELSNIDPEITSSDLKKLLDGFFENLRDVRIVPIRVGLDVISEVTAYAIFSDSPSALQALSKIENSSIVIEKSDDPRCWRPLSGRFGVPPNRKKDMKARYHGHLRKTDVDNAKRAGLPDKKDVLSTSHCSQPNTIEYELGVEWKVLAEQHKVQKELLVKRQMEEIQRIMQSG